MLSWQRTLKSTSVLGNIWGRKHATEGLVYKNTARKHHLKVGQPGEQPSQTLRPSRKKVLYSINKRVEKPANCVSKVSVWNRECKSERPCDELRSPVPSWTRQLQLQTLALQKGTAKTAKKSMDASRQAFDLLLPFCFCCIARICGPITAAISDSQQNCGSGTFESPSWKNQRPALPQHQAALGAF